jgi:hypothetical protein
MRILRAAEQIDGGREVEAIDLVPSHARDFIDFLKGEGFSAPKDAGVPGTGDEMDDLLYEFFSGNAKTISDVSAYLLEDWANIAYGSQEKTAETWAKTFTEWAAENCPGTDLLEVSREERSRILNQYIQDVGGEENAVWSSKTASETIVSPRDESFFALVGAWADGSYFWEVIHRHGHNSLESGFADTEEEARQAAVIALEKHVGYAYSSLKSHSGRKQASNKVAFMNLNPEIKHRHLVAGWNWDDQLNGYVTAGDHEGSRTFECSCGNGIESPGMKTCSCGKVWNSYTIASSENNLLVCREVPRRDVMLAKMKTASFPGSDTPFD